MKKHIKLTLTFLLAFCLHLSSCTTTPVTPPPASAPSAASDTVEPRLTLAWGTSHPDWDNALYAALGRLPVGTVQMPCKRISQIHCAAQLLSVIAKYESSFKPETKYNETGHLAGVVSRGLLQISKDSANGYGCNITDSQQLHDPKVNLECGVKILARWSQRTGTMIDGTSTGGCGKYWSVCRSKNGTSKSYKAIVKYMEQF